MMGRLEMLDHSSRSGLRPSGTEDAVDGICISQDWTVVQHTKRFVAGYAREDGEQLLFPAGDMGGMVLNRPPTVDGKVELVGECPQSRGR